MSGAAEGIAGLVLSAVSVAALFTTCIECFDIVVAGKNFSEDYEQLCALVSLHSRLCIHMLTSIPQFSLQRARFGLWGESVGLIPNPCDGRRLRYNKNIDRPDIKPGVERILNNIKSLLAEAGRVDKRYGLNADLARGSDVSTSRGIDIFKDSFDRFKSRIRKHQKDTSAWRVTRWAIHDATKFEDMINRLEKFVDGLESITKSLGLLEQQHARLREEIEDLSDVQSLKLLRDASSSHHSSHYDVSDTASRRLTRTVTESILEKQTLASRSIAQGTGTSFVTAPSVLDEKDTGALFAQATRLSLASVNTGTSTQTESVRSVEPIIPEAWPKSVKSDLRGNVQRHPPQIRQAKSIFKPDSSCEGCLEEHYRCVPDPNKKSCTRCLRTKKKCSFLSQVEEVDENTGTEAVDGRYSQAAPPFLEPARAEWDLPQNQRLLKDLIQKADPPRPLSFASGDASYGNHLKDIKSQDEDHWLNSSGKLLVHAQSGTSAAKRMFFELRNIKKSKVSFISATPLEDSLYKVLASIEGPPETPYEGGVFWITVKLSEQDPFGAPLMRFQTKIYHPNISPQGEICADYRERWYCLGNGNVRSRLRPQSMDQWYGPATSPRETQWSLGSLLTALCGLLASPVVDDPLVPEIAQMYLKDYDGYCRHARLYTQRYAMRQRPEKNNLIFLEELPERDAETMSAAWSSISHRDGTDINSHDASNIGHKSWVDSDADSLQRSLRERYDDKFPDRDADSLQRSLQGRYDDKWNDSDADSLRRSLRGWPEIPELFKEMLKPAPVLPPVPQKFDKPDHLGERMLRGEFMMD